MRIARREGDRILWIAGRTVVLDASHHRDELRAGARQVDEVESEGVGQKFHFPQAPDEVVVDAGAQQSPGIHRPAHVHLRGRQDGELAGNVRVVRVNFVDNNNQLWRLGKMIEKNFFISSKSSRKA